MGGSAPGACITGLHRLAWASQDIERPMLRTVSTRFTTNGVNEVDPALAAESSRSLIQDEYLVWEAYRQWLAWSLSRLCYKAIFVPKIALKQQPGMRLKRCESIWL